MSSEIEQYVSVQNLGMKLQGKWFESMITRPSWWYEQNDHRRKIWRRRWTYSCTSGCSRLMKKLSCAKKKKILLRRESRKRACLFRAGDVPEVLRLRLCTSRAEAFNTVFRPTTWILGRCLTKPPVSTQSRDRAGEVGEARMF